MLQCTFLTVHIARQSVFKSVCQAGRPLLVCWVLFDICTILIPSCGVFSTISIDRSFAGVDEQSKTVAEEGFRLSAAWNCHCSSFIMFLWGQRAALGKGAWWVDQLQLSLRSTEAAQHPLCWPPPWLQPEGKIVFWLCISYCGCACWLGASVLTPCFMSQGHSSFLTGFWSAHRDWRSPPKVRSSYPINCGLCLPAPAAGLWSPLCVPLPVWDSAVQAPREAVVMCQESEGCTLFA